MITFAKLNFEKKEEAIDEIFYDLVNLIVEKVFHVTLTNEVNQKRFDKILKLIVDEKSERLGKLKLLHDKPIRQELYKLAMAAAAGASYDAEGNMIKEEVTPNEIAEHILKQQ